MPRYIDADTLTLKIDDWRADLEETYGKNDEYVLCLESVLDMIEDAPTADVFERKKGKWKMEWHCFFHREVPVCSQCLRAAAYKFDVCPNCGADMREEKNE